MIDAEIANQLAGPMGGIFGLGLIMGAVLMFAANRKVVEPYMQRAHTAEIQALQAQIALMQRQISELEQFREQYMALLERHSKATQISELEQFREQYMALLERHSKATLNP